MVDGTIVICRNVKHTAIKPLAIGLGLRTKVNANIGTSKDHNDLNLELEKLKIAVDAGADAVMDLSTGGDLAANQKRGHEEINRGYRHRADLSGGGKNYAGEESDIGNDSG